MVREISCKVLETQVHHCGFCIVVQLIHRPMRREYTNKQFKTYGFCQSQLILLHQRKRAKRAFYRRPSVHCIASLPCPSPYVSPSSCSLRSLALSPLALRSPFSPPEENWRLSNSVLLTESAEKQTALLFVNQTSALAGRGILSTQPLKCYMSC